MVDWLDGSAAPHRLAAPQPATTPARTGAAPPGSDVAALAIQGGVEVVDHLAEEWRALAEAGPCDQPFYRPEWIAAYLRAFAAGRPVTVVAAHAGDRLVGVLPLVREIGTVGDLPARKLRGAANVHTCRFDLVRGGDDQQAEVVAAVWRALAAVPGWDVIECPAVPAGGAVEQLLRLAARAGYPTRIVASERTPYLPLGQGGGSLESVLNRCDAKFRANLRRRMRRLEEKGQVRLVRFPHADPVQLERFYDLERAGWKGDQGTAIACDPQARRFYDEIARGAERFGYLSLYALECDGQPVAMHFGLARRGRYYLLKTAYEESLRECSPGQLIVHEVLRDLAAQEYVEFDFLGPLMPWKQDWAPETRTHVTAYVFQRSPYGRLLHSATFRIRPLLRRLLASLSGHGNGHPEPTDFGPR